MTLVHIETGILPTKVTNFSGTVKLKYTKGKGFLCVELPRASLIKVHIDNNGSYKVFSSNGKPINLNS